MVALEITVKMITITNNCFIIISKNILESLSKVNKIQNNSPKLSIVNTIPDISVVSDFATYQ